MSGYNASDWKPGAIATLTLSSRGGQQYAGMRLDGVAEKRWGYPWLLADGGIGHGAITNARPLVVIDPEDNPYHKGTGSWIDWIEEQYLAQSRPPKPEEPTGLGAVVEDAEGLQWVRATFADAGYYGWRCANRPQENGLSRWPEVDAIEVLSEGVTP